MLYEASKDTFQQLLKQSGISEDTVADLEIIAGISCATQFLLAGTGAMGKNVHDKDFPSILAECTKLLSVDCLQGVGMKNSERDKLSTLALLMPELSNRENAAIISNLGSKSKHFSVQFPSSLSSSEQKIDYSVSSMISHFETSRAGVLVPSERPANKLLDGMLQFALYKAGHGTNRFAMTAALPDFSKLAMKAGATEDHVGDNLVHVREGSEVAPRNIGAILTMWANFLQYAEAMMNVKMPDGSIYGQEAGFVILRSCLGDYAAQRPSVAMICSALNRGWRRLCDDLVLSTEPFVEVCRKLRSRDVWKESDDMGRKRKADDEESTVKKLRAELARERARKLNFGSPTPAGGEELGGLKRSGKPCFHFFAGVPCARKPCPFRHTGEPPDYNPVKKGAKQETGDEDVFGVD